MEQRLEWSKTLSTEAVYHPPPAPRHSFAFPDPEKEIVEVQATGRHIIPRSGFRKVVKAIFNENHPGKKLTITALNALQVASEDYLTRVFEHSVRAAAESTHEVVTTADIKRGEKLEQSERLQREDAEMQRRHALEKEHLEWWRSEPKIAAWEWEELPEWDLFEQRDTIDHHVYNAWCLEPYDCAADLDPEASCEGNSHEEVEAMDVEGPLDLQCTRCDKIFEVAFDCACNGCVQLEDWQCPGCAGQPRLAFCDGCSYAVCPKHCVVENYAVLCVGPVSRCNLND